MTPAQSTGARPYHELAATVTRLETELSAFAPMATALLRMEQRAAEAEERAKRSERVMRDLERRLAAVREERDHALKGRKRAPGAGTVAERKAYRRGYSTGYMRGRTGKAADVDGALSDPRNSLCEVPDA